MLRGIFDQAGLTTNPVTPMRRHIDHVHRKADHTGNAFPNAGQTAAAYIFDPTDLSPLTHGALLRPRYLISLPAIESRNHRFVLFNECDSLPR